MSSSGVEFDSDYTNSGAGPRKYSGGPSFGGQDTPRGLSGWLVRKGLAKSGKQATYIFLIVIIVNLIIMYFVWFGS